MAKKGKSSETVFCRNCGEEIDENAEICPECGVRQNSKVQGNEPVLAALLSVLITGAGQIYNGEVGKGIGLFLLAIFSSFLILFLIGLITTPLIWGYSVYDAYNTAKRNQ